MGPALGAYGGRMAEMQEFIDGATAVAAVLAAVGAWSNARRIDRLAGRVDAPWVRAA